MMTMSANAWIHSSMADGARLSQAKLETVDRKFHENVSVQSASSTWIAESSLTSPSTFRWFVDSWIPGFLDSWIRGHLSALKDEWREISSGDEILTAIWSVDDLVKCYSNNSINIRYWQQFFNSFVVIDNLSTTFIPYRAAPRRP